MEYAHNAFGLLGVSGLGSSVFMRGTPFLDACWNGDLATVKEVVEEHEYAVENIGESPANSPMLIKDPFMHTPMMSATYRGHTEIVDFLLKHGAVAMAVNCDEWTALHIACNKGMEDIAKVLLKQKPKTKQFSNVNALDKQCWTPLHHAAYLGHKGIVKALLDVNARVDSLNVSTQTPLVMASMRGHVDVALLFAPLGADVVKISSAPKTPKQYAIDEGWGHLLQEASKPPEPPDMPVVDKIRARSIRIQWTLPEVRWSAPVDLYRLEQTKPDSDPEHEDSWITVMECSAQKTIMKMHNLRPASWFQFRIVSRSWAGWSLPSIPSKPVQTLKDKPEMPGQPKLLRVGVSDMRFEWTHPYDNGAPIDKYEVQCRKSTFSGLWVTAHIYAGDITKSTIADLEPQTNFRVRVRAHNDIGWGPWNFSDPFKTLDAGQIALIEPTSRTRWLRGAPVVIHFESTKTIQGAVKIALYRNKTFVAQIFGGEYPIKVVYDSTSTTYTGEFHWHCPRLARVGRVYKVVIQSIRYDNVFKESAEFCIVSAVEGTADGIHCRKLTLPKEVEEEESEEELALRRQIMLEKMEDDQKELHVEMLLELVEYVRAAKVKAAKVAREAEQESRDAAFKEQLRRKKAEERAAKKNALND
jgi:hypothetical protein